MKIYYYSKKELNFKEIKFKNEYKISLILLILFFMFESSTNSLSHDNESNPETIINIKKYNAYSKEKLIKEIYRLNFKYPHIVYAQSVLETNNFTSRIFIENNNLFGMKEAKIRNTLALGTQYNHAYYNSWWESLLDFALWYSSYARKCKTEKEYYDLLSNIYAEDPEYVEKIKKLVRNTDFFKHI